MKLYCLFPLLGLFVSAINADAPEYRQLMGVTWNIVPDHMLCWDIGLGHLAGNGKDFVFESMDKQYCVDPDTATMSYDGETRAFDKETGEKEAEALHSLVDTLSKYAASSTAWWVEGRGEKVKPKHKKKDRERI